MSDSFPNPQNSTNGHSNGYSSGHYRGEVPMSAPAQQRFDDDEIDLKQIIGLLWHNKWLIVIITGVFTALSIAYALSVTPIYESDGTMIISQAPNRYSMAGNDLSNLLMNSYGIGVGSTIENELQVLNSRTMALDLAKKLYDKRTMENGEVFPILLRSIEKPFFTSLDTIAARIRGKKRIEQVNKLSSILTVAFKSTSPLEAKQLVDLILNTYTELSTQQNRMQADAALAFLQQELAVVKEQVAKKEEELKVFMTERGIVQVDVQTSESIQRLASLESERQSIVVQLSAVNDGLERFSQELDRLKPGLTQQFSNAIAPQLRRFQFQVSELETEKTLLLAKNPELRVNPEKSSRFQQINNQIDSFKKEIERMTLELINQAGEDMPFIASGSGTDVITRINSLKENLADFSIQKTQFEVQERILAQQVQEAETFFDDLPENMITFAQMKRDLAINEQLYTLLAKQSAEMALWQQTQFGMARVVDFGYYPLIPIEPRKRLIVLIGIILGGMLSIGIIAVRSFLKQEIDSVEVLKRLPYPLLSVVPDLEKHGSKELRGKLTVNVDGTEIGAGLVTLLDSISPAAESYRRLQSNIVYSRPDSPPKVILVTSSNKGEGKTTLTSNLAVSMAEAGSKVLLIDCDLRRPRIHKIFGLKREHGLVDALFSEQPTSDFIKETLIENVHVMVAGSIPPNPAEINRSFRLKTMVNNLRDHYDYILLDTPPYGIITDAAPLLKLGDGVVLVCKFNQTKQAEFTHTIDNLVTLNANVIGTTITAYDADQSSGYYYSDHYYRYAYSNYNEYKAEGA